MADRFHRWQNLCQAVGKTVISCRADLREPFSDPAIRNPVIRSCLPRQRRPRNYTQISETLGLTRHTVRKFARAATAGQVTTGPSPRSSRA